nr:uncharacterized protein LOC117680332 isoform X1 [Crassostrea gigas]
MAVTIAKATAKLGVVGGTVYFTAKEGLWGNSKETNDAYKRLKSKTLDEWLPASVDMKPSTSKKLVSKPLMQKKEETPAVKSQQPSQYNAFDGDNNLYSTKHVSDNNIYNLNHVSDNNLYNIKHVSNNYLKHDLYIMK